jgi:hypothetical protein
MRENQLSRILTGSVGKRDSGLLPNPIVETHQAQMLIERARIGLAYEEGWTTLIVNPPR